MKIIVTGGAGFIGSHLVRELVLKAGHQVLNIDALTYAANPLSLDDLAEQPSYTFLQADILDAATIGHAFQTFRPDAVMHLAAESHVDVSIDSPERFVDTNVVGTVTMLQAAREYWQSLEGDSRERFRFLHVSTDEVYGSLGDHGMFSESSAYDPHSPYSASKAAADHLAKAWHHTYGLPVIVSNCSNNYGPYQFPEKLVPTVILRAIRGEPIPIYGKGCNVRDWLHVLDHVEALQLALMKGKPGQSYGIGANNELRNIDLAKRLCGILDELQPRADGKPHDQLIHFVEDRPGHDYRYAIDSTKARRELGWQPRRDHSTGWRETVEWYLANRHWVRQVLRTKGGLAQESPPSTP